MINEMNTEICSGNLLYEDCIDILKNGLAGVLSTKGEGEYPYAVPVNYVYSNGSIYIHGKTSGTKIRCIGADPNVSFTVIGKAELIPEKFNTVYKSVIVYGKAHMVTDSGKKYNAMKALMDKYSPGIHASCMDSLSRSDDRNLGIIEIAVTGITGKTND